MRTICGSFAVCLALLVAYGVVLRQLPAEWRSGSVGSQWDQNQMRAQSLLYMSRPPRVVLVGSSISFRLNDLPRGWYNLSFGGAGAMTGLELIERSGQAPPLVLVEINVLHEPVETQMLDSLLVPGLRQLRGRFSVLRETSSPHHVALRALRQVAGPRAAGTDATVRADLGRTLLERRLRELAAPLEPDELERIAEALGGHVAALQARGVTVGFYEVPEHPDAMEAARPSSVRKRVQEEFPPDRYFWVPAQDPRQYETTDAIHLSRTSATRYCQVLAEAAETAQGVTSHPAASEPAPP